MVVFDAEFLTRLHHVAMVAGRLDGGLAARPRTRLVAGGTEITGYRDYAPGDDLHRLDWNVCARHDELLVREYAGGADHHFYILLDASASMASGVPVKFDAARQAAAALAWVALERLDRVQVLVFADRVVAESRPLRGRRNILVLTRFLESLSPLSSPTNLARSAAELAIPARRKGPVVVISDFYDPAGFQPGLDGLRRSGYSPRIVQVYDPSEADPDVLGDALLVDGETGCTWQLTVNERHIARYGELFEEHQRAITAYAARYSLGRARIRCDMPPDRVLWEAVGARR